MAAGLGTRMRSGTPKHLHPLLGKRVLDWTLDTVRELGADRAVVVVAPGGEDVAEGVEVAVQREPRGTGDAVASAKSALDGFDGDVLVLDGAAPLLTADLLRGLLDEHERTGAAVTVLTIEPARPLPYGRIVRDDSGALRAIVEERGRDARATRDPGAELVDLRLRRRRSLARARRAWSRGTRRASST